MNPLLIARKHLRESLRQPRTLALGLGLPMAFMLIFGLAFGQDEGAQTYQVAVLDRDGGDLARRYVEGLDALVHDDGTALVQVVRVRDEAEGLQGVEKRTHDAFLVLPDGFTEGLTPTPGTQPGGPAGLGPAQPTMAPPAGTRVDLRGDPSFSDYGAVSRIVKGYTAAFEARATGRDPAVEVQEQPAVSRELTQFDLIAPGLMVFAILNLAPQAAGMLAREGELGTLDRIRQSPTRALHLLAGVALAQLVLAAVSLGLMLATARLMGFHNQGSYAAGYAIALGAAFAVVGLGMLIAAFARTQQEAANLGILVSVPGSFLSGSFFPVPGVDLFRVAGETVGLYHLLPTTHAVSAMRSVLTYGRALDEVAFSLAALALLSALFFALGAALYRRTRLAPQ